MASRLMDASVLFSGLNILESRMKINLTYLNYFFNINVLTINHIIPFCLRATAFIFCFTLSSTSSYSVYALNLKTDVSFEPFIGVQSSNIE